MRDTNQSSLNGRLCQILTWGLHEIQSEVVVPTSERRVQELANILELIPPMLANPVADEQLELLHLEFQRYLQQNPDSPYPYTKSVEEFMLVPTA